MIIIFLLLFPWYISAMANELDITQEEIGQWMSILEGNQTGHPTNPTIATEETPAPASTIIIIPAQATSIATRPPQSDIAAPTCASSTTQIPSNNNSSAKDSNAYRSMRRQQQRTPIPQSQTRWGTPESPRSGQFMMRCFYQGCPWECIYNWPVDEEQFRYIQLICMERIWQHCHDMHWGLEPINEYVISQLQNPTPVPKQKK